MIEGAIIRSRVAWHEHGERNTKYFLSLEKRNFNRKSIQYIEEDNNVITKQGVILEKFTNFYESKYRSNTEIAPNETYIAKYAINRLSVNDRIMIEDEIKMSELTDALNSMKRGKTPGSNGFPIEFFRSFWCEVGPFLYRAAKNLLKGGDGLPSHREGIITLIPKKRQISASV